MVHKAQSYFRVYLGTSPHFCRRDFRLTFNSQLYYLQLLQITCPFTTPSIFYKSQTTASSNTCHKSLFTQQKNSLTAPNSRFTTTTNTKSIPSGILKTELMIWWYMSNNSHQTIIIYIFWGISIGSSVRDERNFMQLIKALLLNLLSGCSFHNFLSTDFSLQSFVFNIFFFVLILFPAVFLLFFVP